ERAGIAHELLADAEIRKRHPAFNVLDGDRAYFEPEAGYVRPEECIAAQLQQASALGAEVRTDETVTGFTTAADAQVTTDRGTYTAEKIIIAAGAWLPDLLSRQRTDVFIVRRQVLYWFRLKPDVSLNDYRPEKFPVYIWQLPARQAIYGFPWTG